LKMQEGGTVFVRCDSSALVCVGCASLYSSLIDKNVGTVPAVEPGTET
jgi:hypothetical protein